MSMNNEGPTDERGLTPEQARKAWEEAQKKDTKNYSEASKSNIGMTKDEDPVTIGLLRGILEDMSGQFTNVLKQYQSNADKRLNDFSLEIQNIVKQNNTVPKNDKNDLIVQIVDLAKEYIKTKGADNPQTKLLERIHDMSESTAIEGMEATGLIVKRIKQKLAGEIAESIVEGIIPEKAVMVHKP